MMVVMMYQFKQVLQEYCAKVVFSHHSGQLLFYFLLRCRFFQSQGYIFAGVNNECKINSQGRHLLGRLALAHEIENLTL